MWHHIILTFERSEIILGGRYEFDQITIFNWDMALLIQY